MPDQICLRCHIAHPVATGCPDHPNEGELDQLVAAASMPSLATLFQRGKEQGLIKPGKEYGST